MCCTDYPEYAVYENADTTLEHALLSNTLWQQQRKSMAMSATQQSLSASEFAPPCGVAGGAAGRGSPEVHIMRGIATGMQYLSELGYIHKVSNSRMRKISWRKSGNIKTQSCTTYLKP